MLRERVSDLERNIKDLVYVQHKIQMSIPVDPKDERIQGRNEEIQGLDEIVQRFYQE